MTYGDLITDAVSEIGAARAGDVLSAEDMALGLTRVLGILDLWNADDRAPFNTGYTDFTLAPNVSPHTIGPAASVAGATDPNFILAPRPVEILSIKINLSGTPNVFTPPLHQLKDEEWDDLGMPSYPSPIPTRYWYSKDWTDPNGDNLGYGAIYFVGVPTVAYGVRIRTRQVFNAVAITDTFSQPPGYLRALMLTLAEDLCGPFKRGEALPAVEKKARVARAIVFGNNTDVPAAHSRMATFPDSQRGSSFDPRTLQYR